MAVQNKEIKVRPGIYRHFKGKYYEVIGIVHHSETLEPLVLYKALFKSPEYGWYHLWVRPLSMLHDEHELNGKMVPRYKFVGELKD
jgi:hypothetical protein